MEYPLTQLVRLTQSNKTNVLILVLMEYPLTDLEIVIKGLGLCLNPCSNGIPSDLLMVRFKRMLMVS